MGAKPQVQDNSAQIEANRIQQETLTKKSAALQADKENIAKKATDQFNLRRRNQSGRATLISTSEQGVPKAKNSNLLGI